VRSSFNTNRGTIVKEETPGLENVVVRGVSVERNQAKVTVTNVPDRPGAASAIFTALADAGIIIDVIVQNVSVSGSTDISFTTHKDELEKIGRVLDRVVKEIGAGAVTQRDGIAKLSVVGIGMRSHSGVAARLFEALGKGGVNIQMISTSEIKIAVILEEDKIVEAANLAHEAFHLSRAE
jgi:aspartate kinase